MSASSLALRAEHAARASGAPDLLAPAAASSSSSSSGGGALVVQALVRQGAALALAATFLARAALAAAPAARLHELVALDPGVRAAVAAARARYGPVEGARAFGFFVGAERAAGGADLPAGTSRKRSLQMHLFREGEDARAASVVAVVFGATPALEPVLAAWDAGARRKRRREQEAAAAVAAAAAAVAEAQQRAQAKKKAALAAAAKKQPAPAPAPVPPAKGTAKSPSKAPVAAPKQKVVATRTSSGVRLLKTNA